MSKRKHGLDDKFWKRLEEYKKDPEFVKEIHRFIEITTGRPYKSK
jgi:hypothetical protein